MYIAPGQGLTAPWGRNVNVNTNILSLQSFVTSFKNISKFGVLIFYNFYDFIHVYSPRAGADSPQRTKFWCQQKYLITSFICCKFQKMSLKPDFIQSFIWFNTGIQPWGRGRQPQGTKFWCQQKGLITIPHLLQVSKKSLWSLILYIFFHDLIHAYSPVAVGIQPPGD